MASVITFEPISRKFDFSNISDLTLSGPVQRVYTVSITGDAGYGGTEQRVTYNYSLILKNPCIDPTFVSIQT